MTTKLRHYLIPTLLTLGCSGIQADEGIPLQGTTEQLRVHSVGDKLVGFLTQSIDWVDSSSARIPLTNVRSKVARAVSEHPEVQLTQAQAVTATEETDEAFAAYLPRLSGNFDGGRRKYDKVQYPWTATPAHTQKSQAVGLTVRQLVYDFGATSNHVDAQRSKETAMGARIEARRSEMTLKAITAWHEVFRAQQILLLNEMNMLARKQILGFIEEREQLGGSSKSDVLRVRARLSDAQAAILVAGNKLKTTEAIFRETFNETPPAAIGLPEVPVVEPKRFANIAERVLHHASLRETLALSEAAAFEAQSAQATMLPSFALEMSAIRRDMNGEGVPGTDTAVMLVTKYDFYTGGADMARRNQAAQRAKEARIELDNQQRQMERTFSQILSNVEISTLAVQARKEAVQVAAQALEAVRDQFAFRRGTLLDLLRAQEELYLAGLDLIDGVVDHALSRYQLLHLGMELTPLFDHPTPTEQQSAKESPTK